MEYRPYTTRCECDCHHYSGIANEPGVDVTDALHAVLACDRCRDLHCPALMERPADREPPREMAVWVDPPLNQGDGEGAE